MLRRSGAIMVNPSYLLAASAIANALFIPHEEEIKDPKLPAAASSGKVGEFKALPVGEIAPLILSATARPHVVPDQYIVMFKEGVSEDMIAAHLNLLKSPQVQTESESLGADAGIQKIFNIGNFKGYSGKFAGATIEEIRKSPLVAHVEQDSKVFATHEDTENGAPWGLARVSHRKGLSLGSYNKYLYDDEGGEDVTAYVVDTGIYIDHEDFGGRAKWGKTIPANDVDKDAHGHGTHCAGTIAGTKYGVAKKAEVVAVKVLGSDGSGTMSDVIGGVEWVVDSHKKDLKAGKKGSTANMSLGGGKSPSLDLAVNAAVNHGVHFAVAAGNENQDACNVSPAGASEPITVGATTLGDDRAYFSNYGKCVDIFAPGVNILSAGTSSKTATQIMSGTSMASPHVCGLLTYFLSLQPSSSSGYASSALTPKQLKKHLVSFGTPDVLDDIDAASPNVLAYNGGGKSLDKFYSAIIEDTEPVKHDEPSLLEEFEHEIAELGDDVLQEFRAAAQYVAEKFAEVF